VTVLQAVPNLGHTSSQLARLHGARRAEAHDWPLDEKYNVIRFKNGTTIDRLAEYNYGLGEGKGE
jgi:hypothetical protein